MKLFTVVLASLAMMTCTAAFAAEDGAALYKAKCAGCHGAAGEGKMGPALKGKSAADVTAVLSAGGKKGPHTKPFNATPEEQKAVADYVAGLK